MNWQAEDKYADIINLPHHVSRTHPQMSMADRAAQFSPFAALTGHDAAIAEAARLTDERPILDESVKQEISNLLQLASTDSNLALNIVYFVPDTRKAGGAYMEITGRIKNLLPHEGLIIMENDTRVKVENVVKVNLELG
ncbi:MAG: hypothetical protein IKW46_00475 [Bacteroidaceae bacterium]|nr:hypothetical protein [Bacteroidaceae bacterium]